MPTTTPLFSDLVRDPSEIRSAAISLGEHLGEYELFYELIRFLPTATIAQFIDHLRDIADIDDLI